MPDRDQQDFQDHQDDAEEFLEKPQDLNGSVLIGSSRESWKSRSSRPATHLGEQSNQVAIKSPDRAPPFKAERQKA